MTLLLIFTGNCGLLFLAWEPPPQVGAGFTLFTPFHVRVFSLFLVYKFLMGMLGTFEYHAALKRARAAGATV